MRSRIRWTVLAVTVLVVGALPAAGWADHDNRESTDNILARGHSPWVPPTGGVRIVNSDLAFWGNTAYQGTYNGFRIIDIADPAAPAELITYEECEGNQGDIMIWDTLLIRTWNSPAPADNPNTPETDESVDCGGQDVPAGFEGLHFFDVSDPENPDLIHSVDISNARMQADFGINGCGSHTATLVPDEASNRLLVYNSGSSGSCTGFEIVEIPLDDIAAADVVRRESMGRQCHDVVVFLGDVMRGVCAGGNGFTAFRMNPDASGNGSLDNPQTIHNSGPIPDVTIGHAAAFTWDGEYFAFGHEPGGGTAAECEERDPDRFRTLWVYETETGNEVGKWTMPRTQSEFENCTIHNFNFVPTTDGRDVLVLGNYQAGTWVVDLTDPANATTVAYADPPPIDPTQLTAAGAWSSYWYNGFIWESEETKGFNVFELDDPIVDNVADDFGFLNPQTLMGRIGQEVTASSRLNIKHTGKPHRFQGSVKSDERTCTVNRNVVIKKVRSGKDRVVARTTTKARGNYSAPHNKGGAGRYYAVAKAQTFTEDIDVTTCLKAQSATKRFAK